MAAPDYADEIAALRAGLAVGELTIETNGDRVTYQTFREVKQRLDYFVALAASGSGIQRQTSTFGFSTPSFDRE